MTSTWEGVPKGHRVLTYQHKGELVRAGCQCGWSSTLAPDKPSARRLWTVHIRQVVGRQP